MSQVPIKETSSEVSRVGYWPGHVVAESLGVAADETSGGRDDSGEAVKRIVRTRGDNEAGDSANAGGAKRVALAIKPGSSFSAIISSMLPIDLLTGERETPDDYIYDEFGFRIEREDNENENNNNNSNRSSTNNNDTVAASNNSSNNFVNIRLSPVPYKFKKVPNNPQANGTAAAGTGLWPFVEDSKHKLKWIAYLGFNTATFKPILKIKLFN